MKILLALVGGWLAVTTLLSLLSGWFQLMAKFPNRSDEPILRLRWQSGSMRGVNMNRILRLSACPTGLRVGMLPLFGPFCRDFFVPWESIVVTRATMFFFPVAKLQFGKPAVGTLTIVYDHHVRDLTNKLTELQHSLGDHVRSTMHVHLSEDLCLETIVVSGRADELRDLSDKVLATRGVKKGGLELFTDVPEPHGHTHKHTHPQPHHGHASGHAKGRG